MPSVMQRVSTPNPRHNKDLNYRKQLENVDPSLSKYNEIIREKSVEEIYAEKVQPAFEAFNERQKKKSRRLDVKWNCSDALGYQRALDKAAQESKNKIAQKGRPPIRELVLQYGNPEQGFGCANQTKESRELAKKLLLEAQTEIEKAYPNLAFGDVIFHADEVSMDADENICGSFHIHADFVALCYENKQGPAVQVAFERSIKEMGFSSFEAWKHDLDRIMEEVLERHGMERTLMGNTEVHQESSQWHRQQRAIKETKALEAKLQEKGIEFQNAVSKEIEAKIEDLPEQIDRRPVPMSKDKVIVSAQDLDDLERRSGYVAAAKETEDSVKARAAGIVSQAELQAQQIQQEAAAAAAQMKQDQQLAWVEINTEREQLRQRSRRLDFEEDKLATNEDKLREYDILKGRVKGLENAYNQLLREKSEAVKEGVEKATQPLRAQIQEKDNEIQGLKSTVSRLEKRLNNVAQTAAALISAIKFVAEKFAGKVAGAILSAAARKSESWMKEDGLPEYANQEPELARGFGKELKLDLQYRMKGPEGKGVYTAYGDLLANVDSYQDARERFPGCTITKEKTNELVL